MYMYTLKMATPIFDSYAKVNSRGNMKRSNDKFSTMNCNLNKLYICEA